MKKFLISLLFIGGFGGYIFYNQATNAVAVTGTDGNVQPVPSTQTSARVNDAAPNQVVPSPSYPTKSTSSSGSTGATTPTPAPPQPTKSTSSGFADGTYTGNAENAYYGYVQVRATISGGKLANVEFMQYPNDRSTSRYINQQAMPILKAQAIQAQSANVDGVSGASDTSAAFQQSLASALSQA